MKLWFKNGAWASSRARRVVPGMQPEAVRSVAVIRHAAVGDMVLTRPFLVELRRFFPGASITLSLTSNYTRAAPEDLVDRIHVVHGSDQRNAPITDRLRRARELGQHDILFDLAATARSFWVCKLNRAGLKVGFPYRPIQRRLYYDITVPRSDLRFEAENLLDMLSVLGHASEFPLRYDMSFAAARRDRPCVVYFPSASTPDKCWPHASFADLIGRMARAYPDIEHVVLKGIAAWETIDDIITPLRSLPNVTALELNDFDATVALVGGAKMLVANDTGIRHIAIACGVPTLGIFFQTEPFRYWPRDGRHEAAFRHDGSLPDVEQVARLARSLLDRSLREKGPAD